MAAHILGHVGPLTEANIAEFEEQGIEYSLDDIIGQDGLEQLYESELRGEDGERLVYVNEDGEVTDTEISVEPQAGNTVMLTLDNRLQTVAEQALVDQIHYLNENAAAGQGREANAGAVCAIDIKTGEVLVLASYPTYDPNTLSEKLRRPLRRRKPAAAQPGAAGDLHSRLHLQAGGGAGRPGWRRHRRRQHRHVHTGVQLLCVRVWGGGLHPDLSGLPRRRDGGGRAAGILQHLLLRCRAPGGHRRHRAVGHLAGTGPGQRL